MAGRDHARVGQDHRHGAGRDRARRRDLADAGLVSKCNVFHAGAGSVIITPGGPLRIVARLTWSGRERSSHGCYPLVPQIRLASFGIVVKQKLPSAAFCFCGLLQYTQSSESSSASVGRSDTVTVGLSFSMAASNFSLIACLASLE